MQVSIITPPTSEALTLSDAKEHLRVTQDEEDALISASITASRVMLENLYGIAIGSQTVRQTLPAFPHPRDFFPLVRGPVSAVTSVEYLDSDGVLRTLAGTEYALDTSGEVALVVLGKSKTWPTTRNVPNAVRVTYTAGGTVPSPCLQAMKLLVGHFYENREAVVTGTIATEVQMTVQALMNSVRPGVYL